MDTFHPADNWPWPNARVQKVDFCVHREVTRSSICILRIPLLLIFHTLHVSMFTVIAIRTLEAESGEEESSTLMILNSFEIYPHLASCLFFFMAE